MCCFSLLYCVFVIFFSDKDFKLFYSIYMTKIMWIMHWWKRHNFNKVGQFKHLDTSFFNCVWASNGISSPFIMGLLYLRKAIEFWTRLFHHCNFKHSVISCMCDVPFSKNLKVAQNIIRHRNVNVSVIKQIKSQLKVKPAAFRGT